MSWGSNQSQPDTGNYNSLLGGRATPSLSFRGQFPVTYTGLKLIEVVERPAYEYDPSKPGNRGAQKFWPDGNPVTNLWLTLQTNLRDPQVQNDDGRRVLVLDSKNKLEAVQAAVRESNADFAKNGTLDIEWYGNDPNSKNPDNPAKLYRARWAGPTFNESLSQQPPSGQPAQGGWGQQAAAPAPASPAPATGGWGNPPAQAAPEPAQTGWGAPAAPAPASSPGAGWGQQAPAVTTGWGAPAAPAPAPTATSNVHPDLVEALRKKGVTLQPGQTQQDAESIWGYVAGNPDVA